MFLKHAWNIQSSLPREGKLDHPDVRARLVRYRSHTSQRRIFTNNVAEVTNRYGSGTLCAEASQHIELLLAAHGTSLCR